MIGPVCHLGSGPGRRHTAPAAATGCRNAGGEDRADGPVSRRPPGGGRERTTRHCIDVGDEKRGGGRPQPIADVGRAGGTVLVRRHHTIDHVGHHRHRRTTAKRHRNRCRSVGPTPDGAAKPRRPRGAPECRPAEALILRRLIDPVGDLGEADGRELVRCDTRTRIRAGAGGFESRFLLLPLLHVFHYVGRL